MVVAVCCVMTTIAQGPFSLDNIPANLKEKADIITHFEHRVYEVTAVDRATFSIHKAFTVLNEDGRRALFFQQFTNSYTALDDVEIKVYNAQGKQTNKYKKKEMRTVSYGNGLIDDGYVTFFPIPVTSYPITVELKFELRLKSTLSVPAFTIINRNESVIETSYTARIPAQMSFRYKDRNTSLKPEISDMGGLRIYKWTARNLAPLEYEQGSGESVPRVIMTLDRFSYFGVQGDLSSWKSYGEFINTLSRGLDELPADRQQYFANMVKDAPSEREKVRMIYQYMQQNFRYVSIQLGVGGLKSFPADFTDKKKYGDCKGLSTFMKAALKTVGIKSYTAIINAGSDSEPVDPRFPAESFNHVILCVPQGKDTIWLECTSQTAEFGVLGSFTENRYALLVTDDGGVLVPTPKSKASDNTLSTVTKISIEKDLSGDAESVFNVKGYYRELFDRILDAKKDEQKAVLVYELGYKQPQLFDLKRDATGKQDIILTMHLMKVPEFNAGSKLFLPLHLSKSWSEKLPKSENRKSDFYFYAPFEKYDTTIYLLPAGSATDAFPTEKEIACDYATYRSKYWYDEKENAVYSASAFILKQQRIPANGYAQVKKFFDELSQNESQRIVVKKGEGASEKKAF